MITWLRYFWWRNFNDDIYPRWREVVVSWWPTAELAREMRVGFRFPDGTVRGEHRSRYW